jgi:transketolase
MGEPQLSDERLQEIATEMRRRIVQAIHRAGAGHLGGPLSVTDILVALYFDVANVDPEHPDDPNRDRIILSKGHSAIALYTALAMRGYLPVEELDTFDHMGSRLQGHPDMLALPGVEISTGSLGQGLSAGLGMAIGLRRRGSPARVFVIVGDGESQEGQIWEAAHVAARYGVDNLVAILDWNGLQQYGWGRDLDRRPPWQDPVSLWSAFGWRVREVDGHSVGELRRALRVREPGPTMLVARTVKGQGVSYMEGDYRWHAKIPDAEQLELAMQELKGGRG